MSKKRHTVQTLYRFDELSETAKEHAKQREAEAIGYNWGDDAIESMKELAKHFGGKMRRWEIDWFASSYSSAEFEMPDDWDFKRIETELMELGEYNPQTLRGNGDCKLTGMCADEDAIDGFRAAFISGELDLGQLMQAGFDTWLKACQADCEAQYSDEVFSENCEANDYWFDESGELTR